MSQARTAPRGMEGAAVTAFDSLKDDIYQDAADYISANEQRPDFLVQSFRLLQVGSSMLGRVRVQAGVGVRIIAGMGVGVGMIVGVGE